LTSKERSRKRKLTQSTIVDPADAAKVERMLPY
ncbi:MAG TPA: 50S ribosomal protein L35, partial [Solibacterales bacterium]|nr:50S ribosomal protein L35 [Bryobacterales bacterium]